MNPALRVTVEDLATGEKATQDVPDNDYLMITTGNCHVDHTQVYPTKGTHILTVKGRAAT